MTEPLFNLIDNPWIKVITQDGTEKLVSLKNVFVKGHEYRSLAGETPLQDNAILRLLCAISVTILYRYDHKGKEISLSTRNEAISRFKESWDAKHFSEEPINAYFERWHERFYLIGGSNPFYQVPAAYVKEEPDKQSPTGKSYCISPYGRYDKLSYISTASFDGEILQSGNKNSPFAGKDDIERKYMTLDTAARWLIHYFHYADCSAKIPGKWNAGMTFTSRGANIHPVGKTLFETIMLCSVLLNENGQLYPRITPSWESDKYTEINQSPYGESIPDNLPELYSQISRKAILYYDGEYIRGMSVAAGDRYSTVNAFLEPMFAFHKDTTDKSGFTKKPNHLPQDCVGWKEYKGIFMEGSIHPSRWLTVLYDNDILDWTVRIPFVMSDIGYGTMQSTVTYSVSTRIIISPKYFTDSLEMEHIAQEIESIRQITEVLERFGKQVDISFGANRNEKGQIISPTKERLVKEYELRAGHLVELLLAGQLTIDENLHNTEFRLAEQIADETLRNISILGFIGHGSSSIGLAESKFKKEMFILKKKYGYISAEDKDKNNIKEEDAVG